MSISCTVSDTLSVISRKIKRSRDPEHTPSRVTYHVCAITRQYQSANKLELLSFTHYKDIMRARKKLKCFTWPRTCQFEGIRHPKVNTWYNLRVYKIWL